MNENSTLTCMHFKIIIWLIRLEISPTNQKKTKKIIHQIFRKILFGFLSMSPTKLL